MTATKLQNWFREFKHSIFMGLKLGSIFWLTWPHASLLRAFMIYSDCVLGLSWFQGCVALPVLPIFCSFCIPSCPEKPCISMAFFRFCRPKSATDKISETYITDAWRITKKPYCLDKIYRAKVLLVILKAGSCIIFFYSLTCLLIDTTHLHSSTS